MGTAGQIVITGLMGSGKSSVGRRLAERLERPWHDSDREIEAAVGLSVRELAERDGIEAMHDRETGHLLGALAGPGPSVISAAASVIDDPRGRSALARPGVAVVWLRADPAVLAERFTGGPHRPVFGPDPQRFLADQAARREPWLASLGARIIDVAGLTIDEVVARIEAGLG